MQEGEIGRHGWWIKVLLPKLLGTVVEDLSMELKCYKKPHHNDYSISLSSLQVFISSLSFYA